MTHFVRATRQSIAPGRPARINDLIGPFDTWKEAWDYAVAWRALWIEQRAKAFVETPISPCLDTLTWYSTKLEREDAAEFARAKVEIARRERAADEMFARDAREDIRPGDRAVAEWFSSDARETARVAADGAAD